MEEEIELESPEGKAAHYKQERGRLRKEIAAFYEGVHVGSAEVLALADRVNEMEADERLLEIRMTVSELHKDREESELNQEDPEFTDIPFYESELRIAEALSTGVTLRIQERKAMIPSYAINQERLSEWELEEECYAGELESNEDNFPPGGDLQSFFLRTLNSVLMPDDESK